MSKSSVSSIIKSIKSTYANLRSDPEAMVQVRQLSLTVTICLLLAYGINKTIVTPKNNTINNLETQLIAGQNQQSAQDIALLTTRLALLQKQEDGAQNELAILGLQEKFIKEHWYNLGNNDHFNRLIFTLINSAPVNFEQNLLKTTQLAPREKDGFAIFPMTIEGSGDFHSFFQYLRFLESRPEVGFLDQVELYVQKSASQTAADEGDDKINFKLSIGRLELKK